MVETCKIHGAIKPCLYCIREEKAVRKKPVKKMNFRSKKETKRVKVYNEVKDEYQRKHPNCEALGFSDQCTGKGTEIHHFFQYREGKALTDVDQFRNNCTPCHQKIHSNVSEAVNAGHLASKEEKIRYIRKMSIKN